MSKTITFEKIVNFRDLAGLKTRDNLIVKEGHAYRSALLDFATPNDLDNLASLAPDVVVDFRMDGEKQAEAIKLLLDSINYQPKPINVGNFFSDDQVLALEKLQASDIDGLFIKMYREFPQQGKLQFKTVFNALLDNERVIYHCSAGKDRTGVMTYLILSALGVHYDDIMENYLLSNQYAESLHELFANHRAANGQDSKMSEELAKVFQKVRYVDASYLDALDQLLKREYGGVETYLEKELLVDIPALKSQLLR
ncbi:MAG TPA: tyrosine-protein phosphatase [Candidatus Ignatzschineria merdigallinarum]|uniref:Tyrosine-protein phosphatase n=1 Tax=Candidatus Ignatzschineria merdigallinarum TaxID=2838621 RepID=A0A9D1Q7H9_9GAMM|nr:tyrosine-protein phosphatase [Candidatus Ignatzschineria merdigallinarum]